MRGLATLAAGVALAATFGSAKPAFAQAGAARPASAEATAAKPNIIWISNEDMSPRLGAYGDAVARTPVLDRLARESVRYTRAFTTAPVCAPSRAAIITGMYQTAIGAQHMRTTEDRVPELPGPYLAVPPFYVKAFPEYLRAAGYYTTNRAHAEPLGRHYSLGLSDGGAGAALRSLSWMTKVGGSVWQWPTRCGWGAGLRI